jgi:hypothetical protein
LTKETLENQVYELGDLSGPSYTHAIFNIVPAYCEIDYTYEKTLLNDGADDAISSMPTDNDRTAVFEYTKDNTPLGQTQTVTVGASSGSKYGTTKPKKTT